MIYKLIQEELEKANKKFPAFASRHEAYAVMKEELEEALDNLESLIETLHDEYWMCTKLDKTEQVTTHTLKCMGIDCSKAIEELIQVGAMIEKAKEVEK